MSLYPLNEHHALRIWNKPYDELSDTEKRLVDKETLFFTRYGFSSTGNTLQGVIDAVDSTD